MAVASDTSNTNAKISMHGARAAFYLVYDDMGNLTRKLKNPFASIGHGAGPRVAGFLADAGIGEVVAGEFGPRFETELEDIGIKIQRKTGIIKDVVKQLTGKPGGE
jgi:predicted Fe-Mo cluster-binding NifX family protein